jgi:endonuclease YncB( thermonuclease family)
MQTRSDTTRALKTCTIENTSPFSFNGLTMLAKVVDIIDGDTVKAAFDIGTGIFWHRIRLAGIDTPELHSKNSQERAAATNARAHLAGLIGDKLVTIKLGPVDKYGRILGTIMIDSTNINSAMITGGYARPYDGGKRPPWEFPPS